MLLLKSIILATLKCVHQIFAVLNYGYRLFVFFSNYELRYIVEDVPMTD